jgi:hypothetical protein
LCYKHVDETVFIDYCINNANSTSQRCGIPIPKLKASAELLEDRRHRALALLDEGYSLNEVGRRIGCNASSVMCWRDARRQGGDDALQVRSSPGRPLQLATTQRKKLVRLLLKGPLVQGFALICGPPHALPR